MRRDLKNAAILIVDDQEANVELLEGFLLDEGYTNVRTTTDPRRALPLCNTLSPDLVLLDLHMPYLDGFAVMEQLQACIPQDAYVPILVLTADVGADVKRRALSEGARNFLSKPFDPHELRVVSRLAALAPRPAGSGARRPGWGRDTRSRPTPPGVSG